MAESTDDDSGGVILDGPFDPDAQATVTDYVDYTEYLPADLVRSLTLIRGLDERYLEAVQTVHELTKTYGRLPHIPSEERPNAQALRKEISKHLDRAINARESAYGEACRLYDVVDRHFDRLDCIKQKLHALPQPAPPEPERDNKHGRTGRKGEGAPTTRITLRLDNKEILTGATQKSRSRRAAVAAEHLAGFNPDSPIASTEHSDVETDAKTAQEQGGVARSSKTKAEKQIKRTRPPARTNAVAGISTSNALALLKPPPEDAKLGSEDLPWLRLTDWEMTKLRKKMKKNAVWQPSEVMIHRELALRGRGWEAYRAAKAEAEETGAEFIDCDDVANTYVPGKLTRKSDATDDAMTTTTETKLSNRGMKLNEAKKLKREHQAREQAAAAAAEAGLAAKRLGELGSPYKGLVFGTSPEASAKDKGRSSRKRKLDGTVAAFSPPDAEATSTAKKRKASKATSTGLPGEARASISTASVATNTTNVSSDDVKKSPRLPSPTGSKRSTAPASVTAAASKTVTSPTPPAAQASSSRLRSAAASAEPTAGGRDLRRKSATPAVRAPVHEPSNITAPAGGGPSSRRRKRPAPGPVSSGQDGGAAVSYGRRKAKPAKKRIGAAGGAREQVLAGGGGTGTGTGSQSQKDGSTTAPNQDIRIDEDGVLEEIDPNEPRYCICGDVSFGTMICCENADCDKEWFHLECVGLTEVPSRTAKWYCPDCRVKFHKGPDGIVRTGSRR